MNKEAKKRMREAEDILLNVMKGITLKADRLGVIKPVELEAAKVLTYLLKIEAALKEDPEETELAAVPEEPARVEDKELICEKAAELLRFTRAGANIKEITYRVDPFMETEYAVILWGHKEKQIVDITADSGVAIIKDICKAL